MSLTPNEKEVSLPHGTNIQPAIPAFVFVSRRRLPFDDLFGNTVTKLTTLRQTTGVQIPFGIGNHGKLSATADL